MPELPEVETTRRGLEPHLCERRVAEVRVREPRLRWPVPEAMAEELPGARIQGVARRAKYLLVSTDSGTLLVHLGMSGSLRLVAGDAPLKRHDHLDWVLDDGHCLRLHDPRRFGAVLWTRANPGEHALLRHLGPEPFDPSVTGAYLHRRARGRRLSVKAFIMDAGILVGVGNIYANEALYRAGIDPRRAAGRIAAKRYARLAEAIRGVLQEAIDVGGSTLRDFVNGQGEPGYFVQRLSVYAREGEPCHACQAPLKSVRLAQRATVFCPRCQR